jgi:hypothetical protein
MTQNNEGRFPGEPWPSDNVGYVKDWLVGVGKKLAREGRLAVKPPKWEEAKLDKGLDAISFLFKSYRVSGFMLAGILCACGLEYVCSLMQ